MLTTNPFSDVQRADLTDMTQGGSSALRCERKTHLRITDFDVLANRNFYDTIPFQSISGNDTLLEEADKKDTLITTIY
jgi:hypothetical protein